MQLDQLVYFPPFCLDPFDVCLWQGTDRIALIPKDFAMLAYLATHPQRLISYEELFNAVWKETVVSHGVLKVHLCRIRRALHDDATNPRFIETVPRQGYRFIASLMANPSPVPPGQDPERRVDLTLRALQSALASVNQEENSAQLHVWLEDVVHKVRSLASVSQRQLLHAA
jgi:DNA-binding winged helix-turn-helix (wHTH) protein